MSGEIYIDVVFGANLLMDYILLRVLGMALGLRRRPGKMPCGSSCGSSFFLPCSLVSERSFSGCRYPARTLCRRNDPDRIRRKERRPSSEYSVYAVCRGVSLGRIS